MVLLTIGLPQRACWLLAAAALLLVVASHTSEEPQHEPLTTHLTTYGVAFSQDEHPPVDATSADAAVGGDVPACLGGSGGDRAMQPDAALLEGGGTHPEQQQMDADVVDYQQVAFAGAGPDDADGGSGAEGDEQQQPAADDSSGFTALRQLLASTKAGAAVGTTGQQGAPAAASTGAAGTAASSTAAGPKDLQTKTGSGSSGASGGGVPVRPPDCGTLPIPASMMQLAQQADVIATGIAIAAGPGHGVCADDGALTASIDNSTTGSGSGTNFVLVGLQCVHKGLVRCRENSEDVQDCLVLLEVPVHADAAPCSLAQGGRYVFFMQAKAGSCGGHYLAMYERVYHAIRAPLAGTGCSFFPCFPPTNDLETRLQAQCAAPGATPTPTPWSRWSQPTLAQCDVDKCNPQVTRSPCANDTALECRLKTCPGKYMYFNAIMPTETCFEVYHWRTSGLPTNCYGQQYINNRLRQIEALKQASAAASQDAAAGAPPDDLDLAQQAAAGQGAAGSG